METDDEAAEQEKLTRELQAEYRQAYADSHFNLLARAMVRLAAWIAPWTDKEKMREAERHQIERYERERASTILTLRSGGFYSAWLTPRLLRESAADNLPCVPDPIRGRRGQD